jgi:putative intracellular protease/amidase
MVVGCRRRELFPVHSRVSVEGRSRFAAAFSPLPLDSPMAYLRSLALASMVAILLPCTLGGCVAERRAASQTAMSPDVRLTPPAHGPIRVAFVIGDASEVVDFAGPWGVFEYVGVPGVDGTPFELYIVSDSTGPVTCSAGMRIVPDYSFANAPQPAIIVVPAMGEPSEGLLRWVRTASEKADLTMSVCNGAFVLAKAGILDGKTVTLHHSAYGYFAAYFPNINVRRGARFVDSGRVSTAGGLTSGIDLALHVVARYYGIEAAETAATNLEYQGEGWRDPDANSAFASRPIPGAGEALCPICEMCVPQGEAIRVVHGDQVRYFCCDECRRMYEASPARF